MHADALVMLEVPDAPDTVPVGEFVPLRLMIRRPADRRDAVTIPYVNHRDPGRAIVNTDLFQREASLHPGESYVLTLNVQFRSTGPANLSEFYVQVNPATGRPILMRLPDRPLRVVPSLQRNLETRVERICGYEQGVKVEVLLANTGEAEWDDLEVVVGPAERVRAGLTCHRRPRLGPRQQESFEVVLDSEAVELSLAATANGQRATEHRSLPVPAAGGQANGHQHFVFLEPRALSTDRITLRPPDGGRDIPAVRGIYPVTAGHEEYIVTICPSDPRATGVELIRAPGLVEVKRMKCERKEWSFLLTVVGDSWLTRPVRLYYDVQRPGQVVQQGELYLAVRPSSVRLWALAATAGAAVTVRGVTALAPTLLHPEFMREDLLSSLSELLGRRWTDWLAFLSIPLIRGGLGLLDWLVRLIRES
jgi:hypothetical protein